ncbi:plasmid pRiA4b ORF-3 family protein [bacterium]|nr:plasmid pRiA4b ORF-3 family protein [bacterium]
MVKAYQFKIELCNIEPKIWRRILVPEDYSFWDLHIAIQCAMGWEDCHLNEFIIDHPLTGVKVRIGYPRDELEDIKFVTDDYETPIKDYFNSKNRIAEYLYDFGDDWKHDIILEEIIEMNEPGELPKCLDGERACPPEDCGGVFGYCKIIEALEDIDNPKFVELLEKHGDYAPEKFNKDEIIFDDPDERRASA